MVVLKKEGGRHQHSSSVIDEALGDHKGPHKSHTTLADQLSSLTQVASTMKPLKSSDLVSDGIAEVTRQSPDSPRNTGTNTLLFI